MKIRALVLVAALLAAFVVSTRGVMAANPAIVMVYGERLPAPIYLVSTYVDDMVPYEVLWNWNGAERTSESLTDRPYLKIAMFWGFRDYADIIANPARRSELKPEQASQHGRLYLPTATKPGMVLVTAFSGTGPKAIPATVSEFSSMRLIDQSFVPVAQGLGIPKF